MTIRFVLPPKYEHSYLGDGVYAYVDSGVGLVLTTGSHEVTNADNAICLEQDVLDALMRYLERATVTASVLPTDVDDEALVVRYSVPPAGSVPLCATNNNRGAMMPWKCKQAAVFVEPTTLAELIVVPPEADGLGWSPNVTPFPAGVYLKFPIPNLEQPQAMLGGVRYVPSIVRITRLKYTTLNDAIEALQPILRATARGSEPDLTGHAHPHAVQGQVDAERDQS